MLYAVIVIMQFYIFSQHRFVAPDVDTVFILQFVLCKTHNLTFKKHKLTLMFPTKTFPGCSSVTLKVYGSFSNTGSLSFSSIILIVMVAVLF